MVHPDRTRAVLLPLLGTIDREDFDETFTSGPSTFDDVENPQSVEFPVKQPSTEELAARLDREVPRLTSSIDDVQSSAQAAADDASSAKTLGIIGLIVGAVGLIVAVIALVSSRRKASRLTRCSRTRWCADEFVSTGLVAGLVTGWIGLGRIRGRGSAASAWGGARSGRRDADAS